MFEFREVAMPYPGLRPFEPHESAIFFGREGHTDRLLEILQRERFLAVVGPSGCGKSSLVRAGLLPGLASGALGTGSDWRLALLRPGGQPMLALAQALLSPYGLGRELVGEARLPKDAEDVTADVALVAAELRRGPAALAGLAQTAAARRPEGAAPFNLLVLVDQFEELFTYAETLGGAGESQEFVDLLLAARAACLDGSSVRSAKPALPETAEDTEALNASLPCRVYVALTMRTDFLGSCVRFLELPEAINRAQYLTPRLNPQELASAITGPAQVFGGEVDAGLVDGLVESIRHDSDQLPILQHALARMWRVAAAANPDAPVIDASCAEAVGGVAGALNRHADEVLAALTPEQQILAEALFRAITERREGGQDVRRPQSLAAIAGWAGVAVEDLKPVIEVFAASEVSFLHYGRELADSSVIDLTHEALIRQWEMLKQWVASEGQRGQGYGRWTRRAAEYREGGGLLAGGELARALDWWNPTEPEEPVIPAGMPESRHTDVSLQIRTALESSPGANGKLPSMALDSGIPAGMTVSCGPGVPDDSESCAWEPKEAWVKRYSEAQDAERHEEFEHLRRFLINSRNEEQRRRERELKQKQLEEQAEAERRRAEKERQLASAARASANRAGWLAKIVAMVALLAIGLAGAAFAFKRQAQSAEKQAVTAEKQVTASLFESQLTHGSLLARLEDCAEALRVLAESNHLDKEIPASRRHTRNLVAGYAEMMGGRTEQVYKGAGAALSGGVAISPDGKLLAVAGQRGTLVLFDADSGKLLRRLEGHDPQVDGGGVNSVVFDPRGRWLFSGGDDSRIIRWSLPDGNKLDEWHAPDSIYALGLSPDGEILASGGKDKLITLWIANNGKKIRVLAGHAESIAIPNGLAFSPDGSRVASASYDKTARIWDWRRGKLLHTLQGHKDRVQAVAFSPDGEQLATASTDNQVIFWDAKTGRLLRTLRGHQNTVFGLAFNANQLLSASRDKTLRLWDVASGITRRIYQGHEAGLWSVAMRGERIYTAADDATVRRWTLATPQQWLWETGGTPKAAAVSPAGTMVAVGMGDGSLRLHSLPDGKPLAEQTKAHDAGEINRIVFNGDGSLLATAGMDGKVKLWRVESEGQRLILLRTLVGHKDAVYAVAFSPDGSRLATASYDGQIGLFDAASGQGHLFPAHEGRVTSIAFSPDGKHLLSAGFEDRRLRLWNLDDFSRPPEEIARAQDMLLWASFSPGGREIAAVGREIVVSLYDLAQSDAPRRLVGHEQTVFRAVYSPDGRQLATVSADMTVRLWDLDSQRLLFTLRLPTKMQYPSPLWDFDFRCTAAGDCWIAVPLTVGRVALYRLPYERPPATPAPAATE